MLLALPMVLPFRSLEAFGLMILSGVAKVWDFELFYGLSSATCIDAPPIDLQGCSLPLPNYFELYGVILYSGADLHEGMGASGLNFLLRS